MRCNKWSFVYLIIQITIKKFFSFSEDGPDLACPLIALNCLRSLISDSPSLFGHKRTNVTFPRWEYKSSRWNISRPPSPHVCNLHTREANVLRSYTGWFFLEPSTNESRHLLFVNPIFVFFFWISFLSEIVSHLMVTFISLKQLRALHFWWELSTASIFNVFNDPLNVGYLRKRQQQK